MYIFTRKFFLSGFSLTHIRNSQDRHGRGEAIYLNPLYHPHSLHRHLGISRVLTAESTPLHIASSWTRTGNL